MSEPAYSRLLSIHYHSRYLRAYGGLEKRVTVVCDIASGAIRMQISGRLESKQVCDIKTKGEISKDSWEEEAMTTWCRL